ncbi:hypothetical protein LEP1GSC150_1544 [Leptospira interrogans serovar Copenhageni str. LT2050]|uniref:Uncharacterized protein n=1 Tax=Leptospira interrogans serovar Copenhageni str. LT2050 TaxID=1001598 RepID=M3IQU4_LEPIT|nr:hypothetical protein LEP1GSC150_1544 [Leptospira interrogans serovar Copenhageni str. LT2050]
MNSSKKNPITKEKLNRPPGAAFFMWLLLKKRKYLFHQNEVRKKILRNLV